MINNKYYGNPLDYYNDPGARLLSAQTLDQLKEGMLARYCRISPLTQAIHSPYEFHRTSKEHIEHFEQHNPGYSGDFEESWNSMGMRQADEVSTNVDCCFYGCSVTWGQGVPDSAVWTSQLARSMGWRYNNFAVPALGQEECANLFMVTSRMIKMRTAIFMMPDPARITQAFPVKDSLQFRCIAGQPDQQYADFKQFHKHYVSLPDEYFYNKTLRNLETIARLAQLQDITVWVATWTGVLPKIHNLNPVWVPHGGGNNQGRDKSHPGCDWHGDTAQRFQTAIKEMNNET
jgi:hypothetical protein